MPNPHVPFDFQPELTGIAIAYRNPDMIADLALPRIRVGRKSFQYTRFNKGDAFTIPETRVGRTGKPNEVEFGGADETATVRAYGLDSPIPNEDIIIAGEGGVNYDPISRSAELVTDLIELDREKRTADLLFAAGTYAGNSTTLSGTSQWSDYANSDPIKAIKTQLDAMLIRPNKGIFGMATWSVLSMHPKIAQAAYRTSQSAGLVTREMVAQLLELDEIIVGKGWVNTAKPGQTPTMVRLWGKHASFVYLNPTITTQAGVTFGYTAQWRERIAGTREDSDIGLEGGVRTRVGEYVKELVVCPDAGYFYQNAVA
jgi:hypothetical protein